MASPELSMLAKLHRDGGYAAAESPPSSHEGADSHVFRSECSTQLLERELRVCPPLPELGSWGHLVALKKITRGALASVYRASDPLLQRDVALKLYGQGKYAAEGWFDLGVAEARLLGKVRHPNVVTVYGAEKRQGRLGIWMEYIEGETLETHLRNVGPLGAMEAALIGVEICSAVATIHRLGLLHCDITARNVMREDGGRIVLIDFGFSQDLNSVAANRGTRVCGTPLYMPPELLVGQPCSAQSDIYSIGVLLYHLVTGGFPVEGSTLDSVRAIHSRGERVLLRNRRPGLPDSFLRIVDQSLAAEAERRFETCGHMGSALSDFIHGDASEISHFPADAFGSRVAT